MSDITITMQQTIKLDRIGNLLCSAFEGGSNYWYTITAFTAPAALTYRTDAERVYKHIDYPLNAGGSVTIADKEDSGTPFKHDVLNLDAIREGLQIMAEKYPSHFGDFMAENDDATTADVFLQCCCFGDLVYG